MSDTLPKAYLFEQIYATLPYTQTETKLSKMDRLRRMLGLNVEDY